MGDFYFSRFENRRPPANPGRSNRLETAWHAVAGLTIGLGFWYLTWRWSHSINWQALWFSLPVLLAETLGFIGCLLFFHDIWRQEDTDIRPPASDRRTAGLSGTGPILVDILITTLNEDPDLVALTLKDAKAVLAPDNVQINLCLLDDGQRPAMQTLADQLSVHYITRDNNLGFKAGNLRNALMQTSGDFFVICDADTRLFPGFLQHTLGYFRQQDVAWVQTPHWFFDLPDGLDWQQWIRAKTGKSSPRLARLLAWFSGSAKSASDPFLSDPGLFFDVIQRARNRSGASFCCGAGSIHRREAVFATALAQFQRDCRAAQKHRLARDVLPAAAELSLHGTEFQPFRFHVSEDLYTSMQLHSDKNYGWKSIYHPQIECKMLSPWGMQAWVAQRLKYATGTFDLMFHANPLFQPGMALQTKLHYGATFWSYLASLWLPVLLIAPIVTLTFGTAPVSAYSGAFFLHLVPFLLANELALTLGCWGHDVQKGRALAVASMPLNFLAFGRALRNRKPDFKPTPKTPMFSIKCRFVIPHVLLILATLLAMAIGLVRFLQGDAGFSATLIIANIFWAAWNIFTLSAAPRAALWRDPVQALTPATNRHSHMVSDASA